MLENLLPKALELLQKSPDLGQHLDTVDMLFCLYARFLQVAPSIIDFQTLSSEKSDECTNHHFCIYIKVALISPVRANFADAVLAPCCTLQCPSQTEYIAILLHRSLVPDIWWPLSTFHNSLYACFLQVTASYTQFPPKFPSEFVGHFRLLNQGLYARPPRRQLFCHDLPIETNPVVVVATSPPARRMVRRNCGTWCSLPSSAQRRPFWSAHSSTQPSFCIDTHIDSCGRSPIRVDASR